MTKARTIGLTAAAFIACAGAAAAATITQMQSFGPAAVSFTHNFSFSGFNTSLGTLTSVTDTLTESLSGSIDVTNTSTTSGATIDSATIMNFASKTFGTVLGVSTTNSATMGLTFLSPGQSTTLSLGGSSSKTGTEGLYRCFRCDQHPVGEEAGSAPYPLRMVSPDTEG